MNLYPPSKLVCARAAITLLVSVFIIIVAYQLPATHAAATFTVNSLLDTPDATPGDGTCANANGACTLRAAIQEANSFFSARDDEGRTYNLPVEALNPVATVMDVTQVVVRLPDNVIGAPRDLWVKVTLRGPGSNEAFIKIGAP